MNTISIDSSLEDQLQFLYPLENEKELSNRQNTIRIHNNQSIIRKRLETVLKFTNLGFAPYNKFNSKFQQIIRKDESPHNDFPTAYDFFLKLSTKINDKHINGLLDLEVIYFLYTRPFAIEHMNYDGLQNVKKLNNMFPSYAPASSIQIYLIFPISFLEGFDEKKQTIDLLKQNVEYILSLDLSKYNFPNDFFDSKALDNIIFYHLNDNFKQNFSLKGVEILYEIHKLFGDSHVKDIRHERIHFALMFVKNDGLKAHEAKIEEFKNFFFRLIRELKQADLTDEFNSLIQQSVLVHLIAELNSFDYFDNLTLLKIIKQTLPFVKLNYQTIWYVIQPGIFSDDDKKLDKIKDNFKTLFDYLDDVKLDRNHFLQLINIDLIQALVEANTLVTKEQLNAIFELNRIFKTRGDILSDKESIACIISHDVKETSLNVDTLLAETIQTKSDNRLLTTEKVSSEVEFRESNFENISKIGKSSSIDLLELTSKKNKKERVVIKLEDDEADIGYEKRMAKIDKYSKIFEICLFGLVILFFFLMILFAFRT